MDETRWIVVVALVAMVLVAAVFVASNAPNQVSYSIRPRLLIALWNKYSNVTRGILIANNVGVPGGILYSSRYSGDGVNGYYPLSTRDYSGLIHVDSKLHRNYTLGDFFEVWGEPLGPFNTLGYRANITSSSTPFFWSMCLRDPHTSSPNVYSVNEWGTHVLRDNETITLVFATEACGLPGGQPG